MKDNIDPLIKQDFKEQVENVPVPAYPGGSGQWMKTLLSIAASLIIAFCSGLLLMQSARLTPLEHKLVEVEQKYDIGNRILSGLQEFSNIVTYR